MQFKSIIALALLGGAFSSPMEKRDLQTITTALGMISTSVMTLDTSIKAISGNPQDITTVVTNSNAVQSTLVTATTMINATQPLSLNDALTLKTTATTLTTQVNGTIADLVAKKAQIVAGGQGQVTLQSLMAQKTASTALGQAVTAKVPGVAQSIAMQSTGQISAAFDSGIKAFST